MVPGDKWYSVDLITGRSELVVNIIEVNNGTFVGMTGDFDMKDEKFRYKVIGTFDPIGTYEAFTMGWATSYINIYNVGSDKVNHQTSTIPGYVYKDVQTGKKMFSCFELNASEDLDNFDIDHEIMSSFNPSNTSDGKKIPKLSIPQLNKFRDHSSGAGELSPNPT